MSFKSQVTLDSDHLLDLNLPDPFNIPTHSSVTTSQSDWSELSNSDSSTSSDKLNETKPQELVVVIRKEAGEGTASTHSNDERNLLDQRLTRSTSDFSRWLEDTLANARGDGASVIDSEDAYVTVSEATRQVRMGVASNSAAKFINNATSEFRSSSEYSESLIESPSIVFDYMSSQEEDAITEGGLAKGEEIGMITKSNEAPIFHPAKPIPGSRSQIWKKMVDLAPLIALIAEGIVRIIVLVWYIYLAYLVRFPGFFWSLLFPSVAKKIVKTPPVIEPIILVIPTPLGSPWSLYSSFSIVIAVLAVLVIAFYYIVRLPRRSSKSRPAPLRAITTTSDYSSYNPSATILTIDLQRQGRCRFETGSLIGALAKFTQAAETVGGLASDRSLAYEWKGICQDKIGGLTGDVELRKEAIKSFRKALRVDGTRNSARAEVGKALFKCGHYAACVEILETYVRKGGEEMKGLEYLGKALFALGVRTKEAEGYLRDALGSFELDDDNENRVKLFLADEFYVQGRSREAKEWLDEVIVVRFEDPAAHARLGFIALEALKTDKAREHLRWAIQFRERGVKDEDLIRTRTILEGSTLHLSLYFATPADATTPTTNDTRATTNAEKYLTTRLSILSDAAARYPREPLLGILYAVNARKSARRVERDRGTRVLQGFEERLNLILSSPPVDQLEPDGEDVDDEEGEVMEGMKSTTSRLESKGLLSLVLLGLGKDARALLSYEEFWQELCVGEKGKETMNDSKPVLKRGGSDFGFGFLMMAFFELRTQGKLASAR